MYDCITEKYFGIVSDLDMNNIKTKLEKGMQKIIYIMIFHFLI